jgi:hypothetical protein
MTLSPRAIEVGADALRRLEQSGKRLNEWSSLPNATKKKWRTKVETVLTAIAAEGLVLVPKEPTEDEINACISAIGADDDVSATEIVLAVRAAMLQAA